MNPKTLDDFNLKATYPVKSATSNRIYHVSIRPPECQCEHFRRHSEAIDPNRRYCRHWFIARLRLELQESEYLKTRYERESEAFFESFERVFAWAKNWTETEYLASLALSIGYAEGEVTSEDVYFAVEGKFVKDPRILGSAIRILKNRKLIEFVRYTKSERQKTHFKSTISVWKLTDLGREIFEKSG